MADHAEEIPNENEEAANETETIKEGSGSEEEAADETATESEGSSEASQGE